MLYCELSSNTKLDTLTTTRFAWAMIDDIFKKLTSSEITMLVAVVGLIGAVFGAIVGAASSLLTAFLTRSTEERKHYRELGVKVAMAKFEQHQVLAQKVADATGQAVPIPPFDAFLLHAVRLMEIVSNRNLNSDQIASRMKHLTDFTNEVRAKQKQ